LTPWRKPKLPESEFRLYGVCSRYPQKLANEVKLETIQQGVYECQRGTDRFRIVVAGQLPEEPHNALLHLFSASAARLDYGASHHQLRSDDTGALVRRLFEKYKGEGIAMAYTMEDFRRDERRRTLQSQTPEELREALQNLTPEQLQATLESLTAKKGQTKRPSAKGKPRRKH
jgi:hypothetical protein